MSLHTEALPGLLRCTLLRTIGPDVGTVHGPCTSSTTMINTYQEEVTMTNPSNGISITHSLDAHEWSNEETASYEAAIEAVNGAVGAYSARIAAEEAKPHPDQQVIQNARTAQARLAREREELRSTDRKQIADARQRYAQLAREVRAGAA